MSREDIEMERALEADGEKLRQLTGEDHGPFASGDEPFAGYAPCPHCYESCGYLGTFTTDHNGTDCFVVGPVSQPCPECDGTGLVKCEPRSLDDIEGSSGSAFADAIGGGFDHR